MEENDIFCDVGISKTLEFLRVKKSRSPGSPRSVFSSVSFLKRLMPSHTDTFSPLFQLLPDESEKLNFGIAEEFPCRGVKFN